MQCWGETRSGFSISASSTRSQLDREPGPCACEDRAGLAWHHVVAQHTLEIGAPPSFASNLFRLLSDSSVPFCASNSLTISLRNPLAVPTAVAGIYGMNFENMPELKWRYGYFIVVGFIAAICGTMFWRLRRNGWL